MAKSELMWRVKKDFSHLRKREEEEREGEGEVNQSLALPPSFSRLLALTLPAERGQTSC